MNQRTEALKEELEIILTLKMKSDKRLILSRTIVPFVIYRLGHKRSVVNIKGVSIMDFNKD